MKLYTVRDIMRAGPCEDYPWERVEGLVGAGVTADEISQLPIPRGDRLWCLINACMSPTSMRQFAIDCASRCLERQAASRRRPSPEIASAFCDASEARMRAGFARERNEFELACVEGRAQNCDRAHMAMARAAFAALAQAAHTSAFQAAIISESHALHCAAEMGLGHVAAYQYSRQEQEIQMSEAVRLAEMEQA